MTRERIAAAVAALAIVGMAREGWVHFVSEPRHDPRRERIDPRYRAVKGLLPASGEIGYVSDLPAAVRIGDDAGNLGTRLYLHAQYALAPLVLRYDDAGAALVLANLSDPSKLDDLVRRRGFVVVAIAGPGVAVLQPGRR